MKPKTPKHPIYSGWLCGYRTRLFTLTSDNDAGRARFANANDLYGRIDVGIDAPWTNVCSTLLHEVLELCMDHAGVSYNAPRNAMRPSYSNRLFLMQHLQFDEVTSAAADYLAFALPELYRAWNAAQKKKKVSPSRKSS